MEPTEGMTIDQLKVLAERATPVLDGGQVDDYAAGNIDDAFWQGFNEGESALAWSVLQMLEKEKESE